MLKAGLYRRGWVCEVGTQRGPWSPGGKVGTDLAGGNPRCTRSSQTRGKRATSGHRAGESLVRSTFCHQSQATVALRMSETWSETKAYLTRTWCHVKAYVARWEETASVGNMSC